ncbi:MAG: hypothetical protein ACKVOI_14610 [Dongiaceae bacterium]
MPADTTAKRGPPFDPQLLIRQVLDMGAEFPGPAEDILLSWILSLDRALDPAAAALQLIDAYGLDIPAEHTATLRLRDLIEQTARFPDGAVQGQPGSRRRGRRRPN